MRKANYREISGPNGHLANLRPFVGNTMSAKINEDGSYSVFSYNTEIACYSKDDGIYHNEIKYSVTTSKHQGYCRAWLAYSI